MDQILEFLTSASIFELASDSRVLFGTAVVFVLAVLFRWKYVLLFLFGIGATFAVMRYANVAEGAGTLDRNLVIFSGGTLVVAGVLIYYLFIRGD
ncbi:MAG: hypothetical protein HZB86_10370 [Deltaproteobacteria bacterium]|nr:hypothetical protein [Deltaproteobacteria bacterium]